MLSRCRQPGATAFPHYQSRGITICDRWVSGEGAVDGFSCFLADMGERPGLKHTIDRIDNDAGYFPANCRWATKAEQANNRFTNVWFNYQGGRYTLSQLAALAAVPKDTLRARLLRLRTQWPVDKAVETPSRPKRDRL